MWKYCTRIVRQTLQRRLCDCTDVTAPQDVQANKKQNQFISLSKRLSHSFCQILCNESVESVPSNGGSRNYREQQTDDRWDSYTNLGTQHSLLGAVGWSGALILGWVISQPIWQKRLWQLDNKFEHTKQDVGINLLTLFSKVTNGQTLTYILPYKAAAAAPELAIEDVDPSEKAFEEAAEELRVVHERALGEAENRRGILCMSQHRNSDAVKHFRRASQFNYAPAAFNLAQCYELGIGTKQDFKQAAEWYQVASDQGHATAMYNLGVFYVHGWGGLKASSAEAHKLFVKAAKLGQADAQAALDARRVSSKRDTRENSLVSAVENLHIKPVRFSSEENNRTSHIEIKKSGGIQNKALMYKPDVAEYYRGLCHEHGWGVPVDMAVAAEHYSKAALDGNSSAMYNLAAYFEKAADGMPKDADFMIQLYKMAADQGHVQASTRLQALKSLR